MSYLGHQNGSTSTLPQVSSRKELGSNEIATHIRRIRESNPPLFSDDLYGLSAQEWTTVMSQKFRALHISKSLRVVGFEPR